MSWTYSSVSWFIAYGNLNRICTLLLCGNCINLNYIELLYKKCKNNNHKPKKKKKYLLTCRNGIGIPILKIALDFLKQFFLETVNKSAEILTINESLDNFSNIHWQEFKILCDMGPFP